MANSETPRGRAPRGTKTVTDAFFAALHAVPEPRQAEVAKAAQTAIRDLLKLARDKAKAARAAKRGRPATVAKTGLKAVASKKTVAKKAAPVAKKRVTAARKPRAIVAQAA